MSLLVIGDHPGVGVFWFGVPFREACGCISGWRCCLSPRLGLGLLVSTIASTQQQAQQISAMLMMFSMLLTGLVYPRNAMPGRFAVHRRPDAADLFHPHFARHRHQGRRPVFSVDRTAWCLVV